MVDYLLVQMVIHYLFLLLAASMGLLVATLGPVATCGQVHSIQTTLATPGTSTSIQATSVSTETAIVTSVFLFVVFQRINIQYPQPKTRRYKNLNYKNGVHKRSRRPSKYTIFVFIFKFFVFLTILYCNKL